MQNEKKERELTRTEQLGQMLSLDLQLRMKAFMKNNDEARKLPRFVHELKVENDGNVIVIVLSYITESRMVLSLSCSYNLFEDEEMLENVYEKSFAPTSRENGISEEKEIREAFKTYLECVNSRSKEEKKHFIDFCLGFIDMTEIKNDMLLFLSEQFMENEKFNREYVKLHKKSITSLSDCYRMIGFLHKFFENVQNSFSYEPGLMS